MAIAVEAEVILADSIEIVTAVDRVQKVVDQVADLVEDQAAAVASNVKVIGSAAHVITRISHGGMNAIDAKHRKTVLPLDLAAMLDVAVNGEKVVADMVAVAVEVLAPEDRGTVAVKWEEVVEAVSVELVVVIPVDLEVHDAMVAQCEDKGK